MNLPRAYRPAYYLAVLFFLVYYALSVRHLLEKPGLPVDFGATTDQLSVFSINGTPVVTWDEVEFVVSGYRQGDTVRVATDRGGAPEAVVLGPYYGMLQVAVQVGVAAVIFALGLFVAFARPGEQGATMFFLSASSLAGALVSTKTIYAAQPFGEILCVIFFFLYTFIPVLFVHFTLVFPSLRRRRKAILQVLYPLGAAIAVWQAAVYLSAANEHSVELFRAAARAAGVMNGFVVASNVGGLALLAAEFRRADSQRQRLQLLWVFYGIAIGVAPFLLFWALPQVLGLPPLISELAFEIALLLIPAAVAIAIVRHQLLNIELVVNRSLVYAIVLGILLTVYAGAVALVTQFIREWTPRSSLTMATVAAIAIALFFEPLRRRVQRLIDVSFFRIQYDFRASLNAVFEELRGCLDERQVAAVLVRETSRRLPVERIGCFLLKQPSGRLQLSAHEGFEFLESRGLRFEFEELHSELRLPHALSTKVEPSVRHEPGDPEMFARWGIAIVFPMRTNTGEILGFLVLGEKKSGVRFIEEDADLLNAVTARAAGELTRIALQQTLLLEHTEAQRLEELNRLKSYFVSSVSHDLKSPLTSIKMFAELLRTDPKIPPASAREYLMIIEGESERLTRLINNVLDFSKIERGVKEYRFGEVDLNDAVTHVLTLMQYQFSMARCRVESHLTGEPTRIRADGDAVIEALINILANALKYSGEDKRVSVRTFVRDGAPAVEVADNGFGIPPEEIRRITEAYYRVPEGKRHGAGGVGIGLAVVKHIMDAHRGSLGIASEEGKGSTFTLTFQRTEPFAEESP